MKYSIFCLLMITFVGLSGCISDTNEVADDEIENNVNVAKSTEFQVEGLEVDIVSGNLSYPAHVAAPTNTLN